MLHLPSSDIVWTAVAMLASALLTGFTIFLIEQRKSRRVFEEKQRGVIELLRHDVRLTMNGFDRYVVDLSKKLLDPSHLDAEKVVYLIQLVLESTKGGALSNIYNNFEYLPPILQECSANFYRRIDELDKLLQRSSQLTEAAIRDRKVYKVVAQFVYRSMADGSNLSAEIHRFSGRYQEALYEDKSTAQYKKLYDFIAEGEVDGFLDKKLSRTADDGRIHNG